MDERLIDRPQDIPGFARDLPQLLGDQAAVVDAKAHELAAQQARTRELEVQLCQLTWLLDQNDSSLIDGIMRTHKVELDRFAFILKEIVQTESRAEALTHQISELLGRIRSRNPSAIKTVVAIDMSRYSDIVKDIQDSAPQDGPRLISELNRRVQTWVDKSLESIGVSERQTPRKGTGDGAIVILDNPDRGVMFAEAFHNLANDYSKAKKRHNDRMHFRCGIATGALIIDHIGTDSFEMAGLIISNAVRLESACTTGCALADPATYELLSADKQGRFGAESVVVGKRKERFRARQLRVVASAPWEKQLP